MSLLSSMLRNSFCLIGIILITQLHSGSCGYPEENFMEDGESRQYRSSQQDETVENVISLFDKNGDNRISMQEFLGSKGTRYFQSKTGQRMSARNFMELDKNGDNYIDPEEIDLVVSDSK